MSGKECVGIVQCFTVFLQPPVRARLAYLITQERIQVGGNVNTRLARLIEQFGIQTDCPFGIGRGLSGRLIARTPSRSSSVSPNALATDRRFSRAGLV
jgi:hypothetical protein